ncbi:MAG: hypothetical protein L0I88_04790 [Alkalibacterium sp.]|nr:hypothetical protein [Alkalibacterium sp.]
MYPVVIKTYWEKFRLTPWFFFKWGLKWVLEQELKHCWHTLNLPLTPGISESILIPITSENNAL